MNKLKGLCVLLVISGFFIPQHATAGGAKVVAKGAQAVWRSLSKAPRKTAPPPVTSRGSSIDDTVSGLEVIGKGAEVTEKLIDGMRSGNPRDQQGSQDDCRTDTGDRPLAQRYRQRIRCQD